MQNVKSITQSMRVPFLVLTPVCVLLGGSAAVANGSEINTLYFVLALLGGLLAHISVNTLNEYTDFRSGLDFTTQRTQFSGGSGSLPNNPNAANAVLAVGIGSLVLTFLIGAYFVWQAGLGIIPLGLLGIAIVVTYTTQINKYPILCLLAPGLGFGFLMVVGTQYVLEGEYSSLSFLLSLIPFFLVNNLLLLNQYPDMEADKNVGRNHFPIAFGVKRSNMVYGIFVVLTMLMIITYILLGLISNLSLLALLPMGLAFFVLSGAMKYGDKISSQPQYLAANVAVSILTPLVLALSIMMS